MLQPLDVSIFGPFQRAWADWCDEIVDDTGEEMPCEDVVKHYMEVRHLTFKESTIILCKKESRLQSKKTDFSQEKSRKSQFFWLFFDFSLTFLDWNPFFLTVTDFLFYRGSLEHLGRVVAGLSTQMFSMTWTMLRALWHQPLLLMYPAPSPEFPHRVRIITILIQTWTILTAQMPLMSMSSIADTVQTPKAIRYLNQVSPQLSHRQLTALHLDSQPLLLSQSPFAQIQDPSHILAE